MDDFESWSEINRLFQKPVEGVTEDEKHEAWRKVLKQVFIDMELWSDPIVKPVAGDGFYKVYGTVSNGLSTQHLESVYERVSQCRCTSPEQAALYGCTYCQRTNALKLARTYWDCTEQERRAGG